MNNEDNEVDHERKEDPTHYVLEELLPHKNYYYFDGFDREKCVFFNK